MQRRLWWLGVSGSIALAAHGCASDATQSLDGAQRGMQSDAAVQEQAISWIEIYDQVLVPNECVKCHGKAAELDLSLEHGHENLVGVAAKGGKCASTAMQRVVPGDPGASLLLDKLMDMPLCGARMPVSPRALVTQQQLELVRAWIAQGAKK